VRESKAATAARRRAPRHRGAAAAMAAGAASLGVLAAACQSVHHAALTTQRHHQSGATAAAAAQISITPANGSKHAKPNRGVTVTVADGKLRTVTVVRGHDPLAGVFTQGQTIWHTLYALHPATRYTVTATAAGADGKTVTAKSSFRTLSPAGTASASTLLGDQTYGVGMPITINFSSPVSPAHRAQVERAISIKSSKPVVGAWMWDGGGTILDFRTRNYWPQHTHVSFLAHFNGVQIAHGVYLTANLSQSFRIGNSLIGVTSTKTHRTRIFYKGKYYATWTDSSGRPGDDTSDGAYLTIEKGNPVYMSGPGYHHIPVYWSVRFTWSGDYYHAAPWSLGQQGFENVSHGCVNLSPAHAEWYYERAVPGDPITIIGSPVAGQWGDGWTEWFLTWHQLLHRSATHKAVQAGPSGSTLVSPASLPPAPKRTWRNGSKPHNWAAK
jgi:lipoprotein-anchoring transpeptidase ErfK/SrfK